MAMRFTTIHTTKTDRFVLRDSTNGIKMSLLTNTEVLRRIALVVGFFVALVCFLKPVPYVYRVELVDFAKKLKSERIWTGNAKLSLDAFIAEKTEGRGRQVSGTIWDETLAKLLEDQRGQTPKDWKENRYRRSGSNGEFYFPPEKEPFAAVAPKPGHVRYLAVENAGRTKQILLNTQRPKYARHAPRDLTYPMRSWSWLPFALGLAIYFFSPRITRPERSLGYLRLWGLVVSDFLGLVMAGFFFVFPMGMLLEKGQGLSSLFDFDTGWAWLTLFMWALAPIGLSIIAVGACYRNFWVTFSSDGIQIHTISGNRKLKYSEIKKAGLSIQKLPIWLIGGLLLFGKGHPTALGQAAILAGQNNVGIGLDLYDGKPVWIRLEAFETPEKLAERLKENGVGLDGELAKMAE
jgi:hypothetical protein